ncbi:Kunitz/Bovine pancreatic trypsin inhibitor domain protein [Cooperia oncophora]
MFRMQDVCPDVRSIVSKLEDEPMIYYYDAEQGRCIAFTYNGALGNYNNFKSSADCELFCAKLQCKYGTPLKIGATNQRCSTNADCPSTHECQSDHNVCCPRPREFPLRN